MQLLKGGVDDIVIAREFLIPSPPDTKAEIVYPKYRILIKVDRVELQTQVTSSAKWERKDWDHYSDEGYKQTRIDVFTNKIATYKQEDEVQREKAKFKEYTINF